jgi:hypothetical protein
LGAFWPRNAGVGQGPVLLTLTMALGMHPPLALIR